MVQPQMVSLESHAQTVLLQSLRPVQLAVHAASAVVRSQSTLTHTTPSVSSTFQRAAPRLTKVHAALLAAPTLVLSRHQSRPITSVLVLVVMVAESSTQ